MDESWELDNILIMPEQATLMLFGFGAVRLRSRQAVMLRRKSA
jgi:hypothetical protein